MTRCATFLTASIAAGTLILASCGAPEEDSEPAATSASPSPTAKEGSHQETEMPEPSPEEDTETEQDDAPDLSQFGVQPQEDEFTPDPEDRSTLTAVRHGQHEGYERLVFEYSDAPPSLIYARFVDAASTGMPDVGDTSDPMEGLEVLELTVNGLVDEMTVHTPELHADEHWYPRQGDLLAEVSLGMLFEGTGTYFVGLNAETEFQLNLADDPHRVILDFATH